MFQLPILCARGKGYHNRSLPMLQEAQTTFTEPVIQAIVQLIQIIGLDSNASTKQLSHVISDLARGFGFDHDVLFTQEQWERKAAFFAHSMAKISNTPPTLADYAELQWAFLEGAKWALGDWNTRYRVARMTTMNSKAQR